MKIVTGINQMSAKTNFGEWNQPDINQSKVVLIPVPYDGTSTWIKGADQGPDAIIQASDTLEMYDIEMDRELHECGIYTDEAVRENSSPEAMVEAVQSRVATHFDAGRFPIVIGGEHSVSIGAIYAAAKKYEGLTVLQFDAHADLRDEYHGSRCNHACVMARAREVANIVQVGIRSVELDEKKHIEPEKCFYAHEIHSKRNLAEEIIPQLGEKVYITIDLDAFDPSIMPSTGTPEPGGLLWYPVLELLKEISEQRDIVGFDVVELCPNGANPGPDYMAAKLIYKLIGYCCD